MRLVVLGTPDVAVPPLRALVAAGHDVALAVTRPDRRRGRGRATSPSPVAAAAAELGVPVTHDVDDALAIGAELGVVVAYGRIIKPHVLAALPMVNIHFSLLPRWRGAAPVERALLAGDAETGVCLMEVVDELDAGGVYAVRRVPIGARATVTELRAELADVGTAMLVDLLAGPLPPAVPQAGDPTYASKIDPAELRIDWGRPAVELDRLVRVGGAWATFRGRRLQVLAADPALPAEGGTPAELVDPAAGIVITGEGALALRSVRPEGRATMTWAAFANGAHPVPGEHLG